MDRIILWLKAVRAPFFSASLIPVLVGTAVAHRYGFFSMTALIFSLLIVMSSQAGANLINDYYDAEGSDLINQNPTPFSGGSRLIQNKLLERRNFLVGTYVAYGISLGTALLFAVLVYHNWQVVLLPVIGAFLGIAYSNKTINGMSRGCGELMLGVAFGPLAVMGSFLMQANYIAKEAILAGIPVGLLIMGVLILNEFPDVAADQAAGKRNWVVNWGLKKGVWIYLSVVSLAYITLFIGVIMEIFPMKILYSYFTLPVAVWISLKVWNYKEQVNTFIPAMAGNIGLHFATGILICIGLLG